MIGALWRDAYDLAGSVALAVLPLVGFFLVFQMLFLRLPRGEVLRVLRGTLLAAAGLFLFLLGVGIGFLPFGRAIGEAARIVAARRALVPFGFVLGLRHDVGRAGGAYPRDSSRRRVNGIDSRSVGVYAICLGVAFAVAIGLLRIAHRIPLLWLLVPGYLARARNHVGQRCRFSSPLRLMPAASRRVRWPTLPAGARFRRGFGRAERDPLVHGLGLVSLIALAPVISVMVLGCARTLEGEGRRRLQHDGRALSSSASYGRGGAAPCSKPR